MALGISSVIFLECEPEAPSLVTTDDRLPTFRNVCKIHPVHQHLRHWLSRLLRRPPSSRGNPVISTRVRGNSIYTWRVRGGSKIEEPRACPSRAGWQALAPSKKLPGSSSCFTFSKRPPACSAAKFSLGRANGHALFTCILCARREDAGPRTDHTVTPKHPLPGPGQRRAGRAGLSWKAGCPGPPGVGLPAAWAGLGLPV